MIKLSILIPTTTDRAVLFGKLIECLQNTLDLNSLNEQVEIISICDNKEISIGEKRQQLYQKASGLYSWQVDSDDQIPAYAIILILEAMKDQPDCITFEELCIIDGVESHSNFSLMYTDWGENLDGWDHVRTPFFKTPILTTICQAVPVPHIRFGEDHAWSRAVKPLLKTEVHIPHRCYYYIHQSSPHNERYGIK